MFIQLMLVVCTLRLAWHAPVVGFKHLVLITPPPPTPPPPPKHTHTCMYLKKLYIIHGVAMAMIDLEWPYPCKLLDLRFYGVFNYQGLNEPHLCSSISPWYNGLFHLITIYSLRKI